MNKCKKLKKGFEFFVVAAARCACASGSKKVSPACRTEKERKKERKWKTEKEREKERKREGFGNRQKHTERNVEDLMNVQTNKQIGRPHREVERKKDGLQRYVNKERTNRYHK